MDICCFGLPSIPSTLLLVIALLFLWRSVTPSLSFQYSPGGTSNVSTLPHSPFAHTAGHLTQDGLIIISNPAGHCGSSKRQAYDPDQRSNTFLGIFQIRGKEVAFSSLQILNHKQTPEQLIAVSLPCGRVLENEAIQRRERLRRQMKK